MVKRLDSAFEKRSVKNVCFNFIPYFLKKEREKNFLMVTLRKTKTKGSKAGILKIGTSMTRIKNVRKLIRHQMSLFR